MLFFDFRSTDRQTVAIADRQTDSWMTETETDRENKWW